MPLGNALLLNVTELNKGGGAEKRKKAFSPELPYCVCIQSNVCACLMHTHSLMEEAHTFCFAMFGCESKGNMCFHSVSCSSV